MQHRTFIPVPHFHRHIIGSGDDVRQSRMNCHVAGEKKNMMYTIEQK
jgi:hypothetical protein